MPQLGDNNFVSYLITEDDEEADKFLEEAKRSFGKGLKKDRSRGDCLKVLINCKQSRKVAPPPAFLRNTPLQATQGKFDGFLSQLTHICQQIRLASVED